MSCRLTAAPPKAGSGDETGLASADLPAFLTEDEAAMLQRLTRIFGNGGRASGGCAVFAFFIPANHQTNTHIGDAP